MGNFQGGWKIYKVGWKIVRVKWKIVRVGWKILRVKGKGIFEGGEGRGVLATGRRDKGRRESSTLVVYALFDNSDFSKQNVDIMKLTYESKYYMQWNMAAQSSPLSVFTGGLRLKL